MNILTEAEKAYLAGFFDGEGCISIGKYQGKNNRTPVYQLMVVVSQKEDLSELCRLAGVGSVVVNNHRHGWVYYSWRMSPHDGAEFLATILPYLRNKAQEAEIAIEYQSRQGHKTSTGRGYIVPQHLIDEKERYYQTLRTLKGRSGGMGGRGRQKQVK